MAANTSPIFTLVPVIGIGTISTANTNLDGTGDMETIVTGGTDGTRITAVTIKAIGTTTAGMVRLFIHNGVSAVLLREIEITAITPSGTVMSFSSKITFTGELAIVLPSGYSLRASTHNAESFNVIAEGGDYS